jgi:DNA-binding MarR family transcriptional regulator
VATNPGCTVSEAKETLTAGNRLKDEAVSKAVAMGMIRKEDDPEDKRRKRLYFVSSEALI